MKRSEAKRQRQATTMAALLRQLQPVEPAPEPEPAPWAGGFDGGAARGQPVRQAESEAQVFGRILRREP